MSMIRSIRRNIVHNRGEQWDVAQKRRYGKDYYAISKTGIRKSDRHRTPLQTFDPQAANATYFKMMAKMAMRNFMGKITHKSKARNREKDMTLIAPIAEVENGRNA